MDRRLVSVRAFVIVTPHYGVFLGAAMGLAFWSRIWPAGQEAAPAFESPRVAHALVKSWLEKPPELRLLPVTADLRTPAGLYASMVECEKAGIAPWNPTMPRPDGADGPSIVVPQ